MSRPGPAGGLLVVLALAWRAAAGDMAPLLAPCPPFLFTDEAAGRVVRFGTNGVIEWEYPAPMARDVWQLPNGNVLFPYNRDYGTSDNPSGVMEVTPDRKVVFDFRTTGQVFSCQRLADGLTLVGAASQGKLLLVDPQGRVARETRVKNAPGHGCLRNARALPDGHFLVAEENSQAAREYAADGSLVREFKADFPVYSAVRLPGDRTLLCGKQRMAEFDAAGSKVWKLDAAEVPTLGIRWFAGLQVLPNGNLFVCNAGGKVAFAEITRDGKVVWQSNTAPGAVPIGHGIHRLDVPGAPLK